MKAKQTNVTVRISVAWWLKYYVFMLGTFCRIFRAEHDPKKLDRVIGMALKTKVTDKEAK